MLETPIVLVMSHKEEIQEAKVKMKVGECIFHLSLAKFVGFSPGPWQMFFGFSSVPGKLCWCTVNWWDTSQI